MPTLLEEAIDRWIAIADKRNHAIENPITLSLDLGNGESHLVCVSYIEPNYATLPLNVAWVVVDPSSPDYKKALRRVSALPQPSSEYRNTWATLQTYQDFLDEAQFYDYAAPFELGEIEIPGVRPASVEGRGIYFLNRPSLTPLDPVVVVDNDVRMSNARQALPHTHAAAPTTKVQGSTGINDFYVNIVDGLSPLPGQILMLNGPGTEPNEWLGVWRKPTQADIVYNGPTFDNLVIASSGGTSVNENTAVVFTAEAQFSDTSSQLNVAAEWSIIVNPAAGNLGSTTGVFNGGDVSGDQLVRVQAVYTHPDSGTTQTATFDFTIVDTNAASPLSSIAITGLASLNEGDAPSSYSVVATYSDTSTVGVVPATFVSSNPAAGTLNSSTGIFTPATAVGANQLTTLTATYTEGGISRSTTFDITVVDTTVYPVSAVITGPDEVDEGTSALYYLNVTFSDLSASLVAVSDWVSTNASAGTINATTGNFTAPAILAANEVTTLSASYTSEGITVNGSRSITARDATAYPVSAVILGASTIAEGTTGTYQLSVTFTDTTTVVVPVSNWTSSNVGVATINATTGAYVAAVDLGANGSTNISASYTSEGVTVSATLPVTVTDVTNYPQSVEILGSPTMNEGSSPQSLSLRVTYADLTTAIVSADSWTSSNTGVATVDSAGIVTTAVNIVGTTPTTITASYSADGVTVTDTLIITVADTTVYPVSAIINGPAVVSEGAAVIAYTLSVTFDDASTAVIPVTTFALSNASAGVLTTSGSFTPASGLTANELGTITATHTVDGTTVTGTLAITVTDATVYPVSAVIVGPSSLNDSDVQSYVLEVTYTDTSTAFASVTDWASTNAAAGSINASNGLFIAQDVSSNQVTTLSASFTADGVTVSDTLDVTVLDTSNYPVSAVIEGATSIAEGTSTTLQLRVTYTDTSTALVAVTDWASTDLAVGVINASTGVFLAAADLGASAPTTISASYTALGVTVSDTHVITVLDVTLTPVSAVISGATTINEGANETYLFSVTFDDTSVSNVTVTDWSSDNAAVVSIGATTGIATGGVNTTGSNLTANINASYTFNGATVTAARAIGVVDTTLYPVSLAITGAASVSEASTETYVATATYTDASTAVVSLTTWAISNAFAGSINGSSGVLTSAAGLLAPQVANITASYDVDGTVVTDTFAITVNNDVLVPVSATIVGNTSVLETDAPTTYVFNVVYDDGSNADVSVSNWAVDNASLGSMNPTTGVLTPANVLATAAGNILASYTESGATVNASLAITNAYVKTLTSASINGPTSISEGAAPQTFTLVATYDDASTIVQTVSDWAISNVGAGTMAAATGILTIPADVVGNQVGTISASYTEDGITVNPTLVFTTLDGAAPLLPTARYGYAEFAGPDLLANHASSTAFMDAVGTNMMASNLDGEGLTADSSALTASVNYLFFMWPKDLGIVTITNTNLGATEGWPYTQETGAYFADGPSTPIEVTYDGGTGPIQWYILRNDFPGAYDLQTTGYTFAYPNN